MRRIDQVLDLGDGVAQALRRGFAILRELLHRDRHGRRGLGHIDAGLFECGEQPGRLTEVQAGQLGGRPRLAHRVDDFVHRGLRLDRRGVEAIDAGHHLVGSDVELGEQLSHVLDIDRLAGLLLELRERLTHRGELIARQSETLRHRASDLTDRLHRGGCRRPHLPNGGHQLVEIVTHLAGRERHTVGDVVPVGPELVERRGRSSNRTDDACHTERRHTRARTHPPEHRVRRVPGRAELAREIPYGVVDLAVEPSAELGCRRSADAAHSTESASQVVGECLARILTRIADLILQLLGHPVGRPLVERQLDLCEKWCHGLPPLGHRV